jgi:hypothetical protein
MYDKDWTFAAAEDIIAFVGKKLFLFSLDLKCGHKIGVGRAQFLNKLFASVHLSVVLRYIYYI